MKEGCLIYDVVKKRMVLNYGIEEYAELHCGDCFEAYINQNATPWGLERYEWEHVRIEYNHSDERWYLAQHPLEELQGLRIKMN